MGLKEIEDRLRVGQEKVGGLTGAAASKATSFVANSIRNDPLSAVGTGGFLALLGPPMYQEYTSPEAKAERKASSDARKNLAKDIGESYMQAHTKTSSVNFSLSEVRRAAAIAKGLEKSAAKIPIGEIFEDPVKLYTAGLLLGAGVATSGAAALGATKGIGKISDLVHTAGRTKRYDEMLKADPSLKRAPHAREYFDVIDRASPYITSEPHVAAATIRSMMESPEGYALHPKYIQDVLRVEEARQGTEYPFLRTPVPKGNLPGLGGGGSD